MRIWSILSLWQLASSCCHLTLKNGTSDCFFIVYTQAWSLKKLFSLYFSYCKGATLWMETFEMTNSNAIRYCYRALTNCQMLKFCSLKNAEVNLCNLDKIVCWLIGKHSSKNWSKLAIKSPKIPKSFVSVILCVKSHHQWNPPLFKSPIQSVLLDLKSLDFSSKMELHFWEKGWRYFLNVPASNSNYNM